MAISAGSKILASDITALGTSGGQLYYHSDISSTQYQSIKTAINNMSSNDETYGDTDTTLNSNIYYENEVTHPSATQLKFTTSHSDMFFILMGEVDMQRPPVEDPKINLYINNSLWWYHTPGYWYYDDSSRQYLEKTYIFVYHGSLKGKTLKLSTHWAAGKPSGRMAHIMFYPSRLIIFGIGTKYT